MFHDEYDAVYRLFHSRGGVQISIEPGRFATISPLLLLLVAVRFFFSIILRSFFSFFLAVRIHVKNGNARTTAVVAIMSTERLFSGIRKKNAGVPPQHQCNI